MYLFCDESGSKAKADTGERCPGEIGMFAGIFIGMRCSLRSKWTWIASATPTVCLTVSCISQI
jgi:hypothetical protein